MIRNNRFFVFSALFLIVSIVAFGFIIANSPAMAESPAVNYGSEPVASVNGEVITSAKLNDILVRAWGIDAVNHLIGNALVTQAAAKEGVQISPKDIAEEQRLTLKAMFPVIEDVSSDALLAEMLKTKHIPRHIWDVTMKRNAMLRKLAMKRVYISDQMLTDAFNDRYGLQVQVRHIQCNTMLDAQNVYAQLKNGADFAELAQKYSINGESAPRGGLIDPFSRDNKGIPILIRETSFDLADGEISDIIQVDRYFHLIKREKTIPPQTDVKFEDVRMELQAELTEQLVRMLQPRILQELQTDAQIVLIDPILKEQANIFDAQ